MTRAAVSRFRPHAPGISYGVLETLTGYAIRRAQLQVTEAFDASLGGEGMTTQRFSALVLIGANPGIRQTDMARVLGIARSGALAILGALEGQGLVERRAMAGDQRSQGLFLSAKGEAALPRLEALVRDHDRAVTQDLSADDVSQLTALLGRIGVKA